MLKIRLRRMGAKGKPSYRVIVVDSQKPRDGASVEIIGHFDPRTEPETISIKEERAHLQGVPEGQVYHSRPPQGQDDRRRQGEEWLDSS